MKRLLATVTAALLVASLAIGTASSVVLAAAPPAPYFNGFESANDVDTGTYPNEAVYSVSRVASGTDGIASAAGGWHALAATNAGSFTRYGGYSSVFPAGGYSTSIDIYLDTAASPLGQDIRFDWSSAINNPSASHRRDFIFSVGTNGTGGFVMSASNNSPGWPANPGRDPLTITTTGWYTFEHSFRDAGAGVLAVDMSVLAGTSVLRTWTLSDSSDIIGTTVGGNRYGWLVTNGFASLALDNITRSSTYAVPSLAPCAGVIDAPTTYRLTTDCTTDHTLGIPDGWTLDGDGYTITAVDPAGGHFLGAVVRNGGASAHVTDLTVTAAGLANVCDGGDDRLRGILFDGAAGSIVGSTVTNVNQGPSGCQEGNAIEVRNEPFDTTGPDLAVTIDGNVANGYIKNGITANGSVAAIITNNVVTGSGPIGVPLAAQNGIQVGFGATAIVRGNTVSGNDYTPKSYVACGLLLYQADGVRASANAYSGNERDVCNFGKGGGQYNPNP